MKSRLHLKAVLPGFLIAALSLSALPKANAQFTYTYFPNDATVNYAISTDFATVGYAGGGYDDNFVPMFQSPSSPTVNVVAGANISGEMDVFNSSRVNLSGGSLGFLAAFDNSTVNASGGGSPFLLAYDHSAVNMSNGSIDDLEGQGSRVKISGGNISSKLVANSAFNSISGDVIGSCIVDVTGGVIDGQLDAYNSGLLNLYGGRLGGDLYAAFGGTINVFGNDLTTSLVDPHYHNAYSLYSLSGTLADGSVLNSKNLFIMNDGVTYGHSSFNLIASAVVPEPGSIALLLTGATITGLLVLRRRKK